MGRSSTFLPISLAWLASCYAQADIELVVRRQSTDQMLTVLVCPEAEARSNCAPKKDGDLFEDSDELELLISIFVDQDATPEVELDFSSAGVLQGDTPRCVTIALTAETQRRVFELAATPGWSCPDDPDALDCDDLTGSFHRCER